MNKQSLVKVVLVAGLVIPIAAIGLFSLIGTPAAGIEKPDPFSLFLPADSAQDVAFRLVELVG